jgi:hypothetical protein
MYMAFSLGYYYMINGHKRYADGWEDNLRESFLLQFVMIFGSFGDYQMNSTLQMVLFMVTSIMMPLLMMNLLIAILGQTYVDVKEKWAENMYFQKVSIIYDLELIMFWNKNAKSNKFHLLYAKNLSTEPD